MAILISIMQECDGSYARKLSGVTEQKECTALVNITIMATGLWDLQVYG